MSWPPPSSRSDPHAAGAGSVSDHQRNPVCESPTATRPSSRRHVLGPSLGRRRFGVRRETATEEVIVVRRAGGALIDRHCWVRGALTAGRVAAGSRKGPGPARCFGRSARGPGIDHADRPELRRGERAADSWALLRLRSRDENLFVLTTSTPAIGAIPHGGRRATTRDEVAGPSHPAPGGAMAPTMQNGLDVDQQQVETVRRYSSVSVPW